LPFSSTGSPWETSTLDRELGDRAQRAVERRGIRERGGRDEREPAVSIVYEDLRHDERSVGPDEVRQLLLRRALDRIDLDALRHPVVRPVALAQDRRAALVPRRGEEDRNRKAEPLDVAIEIGEERLLLAGRQQRIDQHDGVGRLVVDATDLGRHKRAPVGPVRRVRMRRRPAPQAVR
jgi:hypothetical protein